MTRVRNALTGTIVSILLLFTSPIFAAQWMWARGNLHTHTTNSDGNRSPQEVADWYKSNGYQFLVISDHDKLTDVTSLNKDPNDGFIVIPGEEIAMTGDPNTPHHANAIGISKWIKPPDRGINPGRNARLLVDCIRDGGGIPMVNHPACGGWGYRELLWIKGPYLLEIANMGDVSVNVSNLTRMSMEQTWDVLLSYGQEVYATATDDMHRLDYGPSNPLGPGRGWVVCRVKQLTEADVLDALRRGDFYCSTSVELEDYSFDGREFRVKVKPKQGEKYLIRFVGKWGAILQESEGVTATYRVSGKHEPNSYIRCKVISGNNKAAWTQAFRIKE